MFPSGPGAMRAGAVPAARVIGSVCPAAVGTIFPMRSPRLDSGESSPNSAIHSEPSDPGAMSVGLLPGAKPKLP
jgi:hypothetical protein